MPGHEARVLGRVADEIERYHEDGQGSQPHLTVVLNRIWGLFAAAEVRDPTLREEFEHRYHTISAMHDALNKSMPAETRSWGAQHVDAALKDLHDWAATIRSVADDERP